MSFQYTICSLLMSEGHVLRRFTYEAIFKRPEDGEVPLDIVDRPELSCYWEGFGCEPSDECVVAVAEGRIIGACWARNIHGYGDVADDVPELALAVLEPYRRRGIGANLLESLLGELRSSGVEKASLAVQKDNPAFRIYQRVGFTIVGETSSEWLMGITL